MRSKAESQKVSKFLVESAVNSLELFKDKDDGGFFDRVRLMGGRLKLDHSKKTNYNAVCVIALAHSRKDDSFLYKSTQYLIDLSKEYNYFVPTYYGEPKYTLGEQGLLLWALSKAQSVFEESKIEIACDKLFVKLLRHLNKYECTLRRIYIPMDAAFCLDGLLEYFRLTGSEACKVVIEKTAKELASRCNPPYFYIIKNDTPQNRTSFNNLIYPIHAIAKYSCLMSKDLNPFLHLVIEKLLKLQGEQGQWWWTYNWRKGVVQRYPVYSVHQNGMSIMALKAASKALPKLSSRINTAISKSISWTLGNNELASSLFDEKYSLFWRSIHLPSLLHKIKRFVALAPEPKVLLRIKKEARSYNAGWTLFANCS